MRLRGSIPPLLGLALVGSAILASAQSPAGTQEHDVLFIGSSSVNGALGRLIEAEIERAGHSVLRDGRPSTGFSRPDFFDWRAQLARFGELSRFRAALVYLGGNDAQAFRLRPDEVPTGTPERETWILFGDERRWSDAYLRRTREFIDQLCEAGVPKVVIIPPIDAADERHSLRIQRVQRLQIEGARASRCGLVADPNDAELGPELAGDGVHLNRDGARVVWRSIGPTILGALR